jgi:hypothetical protein
MDAVIHMKPPAECRAWVVVTRTKLPALDAVLEAVSITAAAGSSISDVGLEAE